MRRLPTFASLAGVLGALVITSTAAAQAPTAPRSRVDVGTFAGTLRFASRAGVVLAANGLGVEGAVALDPAAVLGVRIAAWAPGALLGHLGVEAFTAVAVGASATPTGSGWEGARDLPTYAGGYSERVTASVTGAQALVRSPRIGPMGLELVLGAGAAQVETKSATLAAIGAERSEWGAAFSAQFRGVLARGIRAEIGVTRFATKDLTLVVGIGIPLLTR